jgi:L-asparaginase
MSPLPIIVIVFTGGTIASKLNKAWGGVVPSLSGDEILARIPDVHNVATLKVHEFGTYPGPHITPEIMFDLSHVVQAYLDSPEVDGVIVTHGTDTLEETAYFLDCTIHGSKPVVVIGAMRNSSELDWDGPRNVLDAITIIASKRTQNMGTVVCLGGVVTAASEASKTDTEDVQTFTSFDFGPLGRIRNHTLTMYRQPMHRQPVHVRHIPSFVPLLKCYAGMDDSLVRYCIEGGAAGIVIEAFGVGNVTPLVFRALIQAVELQIPVVLVSRCPVGRIEHVYAYEGAGVHLHNNGVLFADYLNGQKARIKLLCLLGSDATAQEIRTAFEWQENSQL